MATQELPDQYPDAFKKMGGIFSNLNRVETYVVTVLTTFFMDFSNPQSEKTFILNDAFFDEAIFPTLENKRRMLIKVIKHLWRVAEEYNVAFDKAGFLRFCESINDIQKIRNEIAHHSLGFLPDGKVRYQVRKSNEERLNDRKTGKKTGTIKFIDIDLDEGLRKSKAVCDEAEKFLSDFLKQSQEVLIAQHKGQSGQNNSTASTR